MYATGFTKVMLFVTVSFARKVNTALMGFTVASRKVVLAEINMH